MHDNVKIAIMICVTAIILKAMDVYFSPFHTCVRSLSKDDDPAVTCAKIAGGQVKMSGSVSVDGSVSLDN